MVDRYGTNLWDLLNFSDTRTPHRLHTRWIVVTVMHWRTDRWELMCLLVCHVHMIWTRSSVLTLTRKTKSSQIFTIKKFQKNKKYPNFHGVTHRDRGGIGTHIIQEWIVSVSVRTEERVQPLLHLSIPNLINYRPQTLRCQHFFCLALINSRWICQDPYQQSIVDNELMVDNVVLVNKES